MPELPEVETIKNDLKKQALRKKISRVEINIKSAVLGDAKKLINVLENNSFRNIGRRGKLLIFTLAGRKFFLLVHLKMTGQLIYCHEKNKIAGGHNSPETNGCPPTKYSRAIFKFADGSRLFFNDMRRFGYLRLVEGENLKEAVKKYGPEPLNKEFNLAAWKKILSNKKTNIKTLLLNQRLIAGIGNIYADEILFAAGILPNRKVVSLNKKEIEKVYKAIKKILKKAVKYRGTTFSDYVDADGKRGNFVRFLKVYRREKKKCLRCEKGVIQKTKIAGRGTRHCDKCQK